MINILSGRGRPTLDQFARTSLLVAFDYDGTLAPIVERPSLAHPRGSTLRLLRQVARRYPCVVISGRARTDVASRLRNIPMAEVSGNHGIEPWFARPLYARQVRRWIATLRRSLAGHAGVVVEDKQYSVSVHYRLAEHKVLACKAIDAVAPQLRGARRINGKCVVNFLPRTAHGKGEALERARRMLGCKTALYIGDDDTDEEAFGLGADGWLLGVRVGPVKKSRARFVLKDQQEIDELLRELIVMRPTARKARKKNAA
jgi:trehalose 6-phosphate phosphatase